MKLSTGILCVSAAFGATFAISDEARSMASDAGENLYDSVDVSRKLPSHWHVVRDGSRCSVEDGIATVTKPSGETSIIPLKEKHEGHKVGRFNSYELHYIKDAHGEKETCYFQGSAAAPFSHKKMIPMLGTEVPPKI